MRFPDRISSEDRLVLEKNGYLNLIQGVKYVMGFMRTLKKVKPDVVHSWDYRSEPWEAIACRLSGIPYVYTKKNNAWSRKWKLKSNLSTHIGYDNPEMLQRFFGSSGLSHKSTFIPHGIDTHIFKCEGVKDKIQHTIGCVGNINSNKNQLVILKALTLLPDNIKLSLYGNAEPGYLKLLHNYISENNLQNRVSFYGYIDNENLPSVLRNLDIVILASYSEGLPVILLEAMACGSYCISSDSGGGASWLLQKYPNGKLFPADDHIVLKEFIEDYYQSKVTDSRFREKAVQIAGDIPSSKEEAVSYLNIFEKI